VRGRVWVCFDCVVGFEHTFHVFREKLAGDLWKHFVDPSSRNVSPLSSSLLRWSEREAP
jgi:hypothetical protein